MNSAPTFATTPSSRTNHLLQLSLQVQNQQADLASLHESISDRYGELESEQAAFLAVTEALEEGLQESLRAEIEEVFLAYSSYRDSLKALQHCQIEILDVGAEQLSRAAHICLGALEIFERKRLELSGPHHHHVVNGLWQKARLLQASECSREEYDALVGYLQAAARRLLAENPHQDAEALRQAGKTYLTALNAFTDPAQLNDSLALEEAAQVLTQALIGLDGVLARLTFHRDCSGPSASPDINLMLNGLRRFLEGSLPLIPFRRIVDSFTRSMMEAYEQVQALSNLRSDSPQVKRQSQIILSAWAILDTFLGRVISCQHPDEAFFLLEESEGVVQAANALVEGFEVLRQVAERAAQVLCLHCTHGNPASARTCQKCQAQLPRLPVAPLESGYTVKEGAATGPPMPFSAEFVKLASAVNRVAEQRISDDHFLDEVSAMEMFLSHHQEQVIMAIRRAEASVKRTSTSEMEKSEALALLERGQVHVIEGLGQTLDALDMLREYPHRRSPSHLVAAMKMACDGFRQLYDLHLKVTGRGPEEVMEPMQPMA